ncbi:isocitrate dehydrogenase [NADP] 2 [Sphaeroforma arctica JP610]|uniref:Isocitrate dehydrogenase [NADP] 2 n=1 Tax=Sphaeroforma arctica JP610 TaxID=667725 RepID=A0A0L0G9U0_9EUKA|nr:isocitrate dehydrogenase [NADP] 2 [Sphaeroforma arctica JP610]KNC85797.1 isocitrate dehydrogenase [NADP] 2 [Sphaeroforma arctica JP610]|eukprot:XP_014159699.1 isocitrate dehydrogenase [NADP] 2 [Sphaeroforma arctica JP610]
MIGHQSIRLLASRKFSSSSRNAAKVVYTYTDEAPALATAGFLPILNKFTNSANVAFEISDISVASRVLALWPDRLSESQRKPDNLAALGELAKTPDANIIKLPNVSASVPQLKACIAELQAKGYDVPSYPQSPTNSEEEVINKTYAKVLGSAVNPVLREGNSDRRAAAPVKAFAQAHPKKMGAWTKDSKTHVAFMKDGDFYGSEKSFVMPKAGSVRMEFENKNGDVKVMKKTTPLLDNEVIDASFMSRAKLAAFVEHELADAKAQDILLSLHLKATMMKVSDPRMFGTVVEVFFKDVFSKHASLFKELGVNANNGFGDVLEKIQNAPADVQKQVLADVDAAYKSGPSLAYVNSDKGITNLHVPSDVIVDASMPVVIRDSGKMYNKAGNLQDTKCVIPDRCYARVFQTAVDFVKQNGQFDAATMGHTSNVGLMAQKAEEYGSHDKTFEMSEAGTMRVINENDGSVVFEHQVEQGDIWRMCQTKDIPIKDWVKLAVNRARASNTPAIFWLDPNRPHDANLIKKVNEYLPEHNAEGLDITIETPEKACWVSMERAMAGKDTISVTGNVLRDYNTDLFPILELASSSKMLSIVPLLAGGGLYETGAGGSAPKHVQQFLEEGHLRWDSLGEYLATAVSLEELGVKSGNEKVTQLGECLNEAVAQWLNNNKGPSRKVNEIDNRGSVYYLALYWAEAMAKKDKSFTKMATALRENEAKITQELIDCQGKPQDIGGYYLPDKEMTEKAMRPSATLNAIIDSAY